MYGVGDVFLLGMLLRSTLARSRLSDLWSILKYLGRNHIWGRESLLVTVQIQPQL